MFIFSKVVGSWVSSFIKNEHLGSYFLKNLTIISRRFIKKKKFIEHLFYRTSFCLNPEMLLLAIISYALRKVIIKH